MHVMLILVYYGVIFIAVCACVQIFSGLLVNLPSVANWLNWLKYFSIPRYGLAVSLYDLLLKCTYN